MTQQVASEEAAVGAAHYRYARGVGEPGVNGSLRGGVEGQKYGVSHYQFTREGGEPGVEKLAGR